MAPTTSAPSPPTMVIPPSTSPALSMSLSVSILLWKSHSEAIVHFALLLYFVCHDCPDCRVPDDDNKCKPSKNKDKWNCHVNAAPGSNFSLLLNNKTVVLPSKPDAMKCGEKPQILFSVLVESQHKCYSRYNISVTVCNGGGGAEKFAVLTDSKTHITVKLSDMDRAEPVSSSSGSSYGPAMKPL